MPGSRSSGREVGMRGQYPRVVVRTPTRSFVSADWPPSGRFLDPCQPPFPHLGLHPFRTSPGLRCGTLVPWGLECMRRPSQAEPWTSHRKLEAAPGEFFPGESPTAALCQPSQGRARLLRERALLGSARRALASGGQLGGGLGRAWPGRGGSTLWPNPVPVALQPGELGFIKSRRDRCHKALP